MSGYSTQEEGESRPVMWERIEADGNRVLMAPLPLFYIWLRGAIKRPDSRDRTMISMLCNREVAVTFYQNVDPTIDQKCMFKAMARCYQRDVDPNAYDTLLDLYENREGISPLGLIETDPTYDDRFSMAWYAEGHFSDKVTRAIRLVQGVPAPLPDDGR